MESKEQENTVEQEKQSIWKTAQSRILTIVIKH